MKLALGLLAGLIATGAIAAETPVIGDRYTPELNSALLSSGWVAISEQCAPTKPLCHMTFLQGKKELHIYTMGDEDAPTICDVADRPKAAWCQ